MKSERKRFRIPGIAPLLAVVLISGCELIRYPRPFDNPIDPDLRYGFIRTIGEMEYTDRRGVRLPQDLAADPDGGALVLVPNGFDGLGVVDIATGDLTWSGNRWHQQVAADPARGRLFAADGGELYRVDLGAGTQTLIVGEYPDEGYVIYQHLAVTPEGDLAVLRERGRAVGTTGQTERECRFISPDGEVLGRVSVPTDWVHNIAVSEDRIFCARDGYIVLLDRSTGGELGTISWDSVAGQLALRMYPDQPLDWFGAEDLYYDASTGHLLVGLSRIETGIPCCYVLDPTQLDPLVEELGDSTLLPNPLLAVGPDGDVFASSREGLVQNLSADTTVFENPPLRSEEYRDVQAAVVGVDGDVYFLDRGHRVVMVYDPDAEVFDDVTFPESDPGYLNDPTHLAVGPEGFAISDYQTVSTYTAGGGYREEWTPATSGYVRDLEFLPDGEILAVYYDTVELWLMEPGNPTPTGPLSLSGLSFYPTSASIAVDGLGRIAAAFSSSGAASWGYLTLSGGSATYDETWSSGSDELLGSGELNGDRYRVEGVCAGPECVWLGFPRLSARVRYSRDGEVLGSVSTGSDTAPWSADSILAFGDEGDWYSFSVFSGDSQGRLWVRRDWQSLWLLGPY